MKKLIAIIMCASMIGCAQLQDIQKTLGSPAQVQAELTVLGAVAKAHIPANAQAALHKWATEVNQLADANLDAIFKLIPATGSQNADALIASAKAFLTATAQKYGANNAMFLSYVHAVMNALLANF